MNKKDKKLYKKQIKLMKKLSLYFLKFNKKWWYLLNIY